MKKIMKVSLSSLCFAMAAQAMAQDSCSVDYQTVNSWSSDGKTKNAQQRVVIEYTGTGAAQWELNWQFNGSESINHLWGGSVTQAGNQVTVKNANYNGAMSNGGTVDFGFIVANVSADIPTEFSLNGQVCGDTPEVDTGDDDGEIEPPVVIPPAIPPIVENGSWALKPDQSVFNFITVKQSHVAEVQSFTELEGSVSESGQATLAIDLNSVVTNNNRRDQRIKDLLLETDILPTLYYSVQLNPADFASMTVGSSQVETLSGMLALHGVRSKVDAEVLIVKTAEGMVNVSTLTPIMINSSDFDLSGGIEALRIVAGLTDISSTVPVYFRLMFSQENNASTVSVPAIPTAPAGLNADVNAGSVMLNWQDNSNNETAFLVRSLNADGHWITETVVNGNISVLADLMPMEGANQYKVIALNDGVPSAPSSLATVTFDGDTIPIVDDPIVDDPIVDDPIVDDPIVDDPIVDDPIVDDPIIDDPIIDDPIIDDPIIDDPIVDLTAGADYYQSKCAGCHGADASGSFGPALDESQDLGALVSYTEVAMPPGNPSSCGADCAQEIGTYLQATYWEEEEDDTGGGEVLADETPGPRQLSLLSRYQYQNSVKDLLGVNAGMAMNFPVEVKVNGYDNNAAMNVVTGRHVTEYLEAAASLAQKAVSQNKNRFVNCDVQQADCQNRFVTNFGRKIFRRALTSEEVSEYESLFSDESGDVGLELVLRAMLMSPNFLYISEMGSRQGNAYQLDQYEVATQLAYMFTGSTPDDQLLQSAQSNQLGNSEQIEAAARRLLATDKARTHLGHFVEQWLEADRGNVGTKDDNVYPRFNDNVRNAMDEEMKSFFNHVIFDSTQEFDELFTADYVMINDVLGSYYNISGASGGNMQEVTDSSGNRGGLLTLGAVMAAHGHSNETAPFPRAKFVRRKIMCQDFPSPPPDLDTSFPDPDPSLTTREKFTARTSSEVCMECHLYMNGVGFALEAFDGAGGFRTMDNGKSVDTTGLIIGMVELTDSDETTFNGAKEMQEVLAQSDNTKACMARQYYRFARGYNETAQDENTLKNLTSLFEQSDYNLQEMMISVTQLQSFTLRRAQ